MWRWLGVFVPALALLALLAYGFTRDPREIRSPLVGRPAAPFTLALFDGGRLSLTEARGTVVVVDFWASWCVPCREEAPILETAWRTYRDRGVVVVGVDFQDREPAAREFVAEFGLTFPSGPDPESRIAIDYGVYGIPELFVIGRDGRIAYKHVGLIDADRLAARIEDALRGVVSGAEGRGDGYQRAQ